MLRITSKQLRRIIREVVEDGDDDDGPRVPVGPGLDSVVKHRAKDIHGEFLAVVQEDGAVQQAILRLLGAARAAAKRHPTMGRALTQDTVGPESDFEMTAALGIHETLANALAEAFIESGAGR